MDKIILSADSTCDLSDELKKRYQVNNIPLHVILGDKDHLDGVDITADDIYEDYQNNHLLPKTAAITPYEYLTYFKKWTDQGYSVIHLNLSSSISSTYQNCCIAAQELKNVYPIDSHNLSTGIGLLVIEAAERIAKGMEAKEIAKELTELRTKVQASFVLDNLEYLQAGGRCSSLVALGANLLSIKPCIEVNSSNGKMEVGKKYRGSLDTALKRYATDKISGRTDIDYKRIFITHSGISEERINIVREVIEQYGDFEEINITRAGCTISSHCGPNTLGVLFLTKYVTP